MYSTDDVLHQSTCFEVFYFYILWDSCYLTYNAQAPQVNLTQAQLPLRVVLLLLRQLR